LQESFIKIWQGAGTFRSDKAAGMTWLCAVTRNRAIDRLRRHARTPLPIEEAAEVPDDAPSPEDAAAARGDLRRFNECLGTLAPSHAEAVRAAYLKGWTYREASEAMAVPVNTVKTWVRRGLITLRECMNR
jgi:RNA polymerase sigma-70 factor (ECF subfamily)